MEIPSKIFPDMFVRIFPSNKFDNMSSFIYVLNLGFKSKIYSLACMLHHDRLIHFQAASRGVNTCTQCAHFLTELLRLDDGINFELKY